MPTFTNQCSPKSPKVRIVNEITFDDCAGDSEQGAAKVSLDHSDLKEISLLKGSKRNDYFVNLVGKLAESAGVNASKENVAEQAAVLAKDLNEDKLLKIYGLRIRVDVIIFVRDDKIVGILIIITITRP